MKLLDFTRRYPTFYIVMAAFVTTEIVLTGLVTAKAGNVRAEEYAAICLACFYALLYLTRDVRSVTTVVALVMTVVADAFFVLCRPMLRLPAMLSFSIVQLAYFVRLLRNIPRKRRIFHIVLRGTLILLAEGSAALVLGENADALAVISLFYYVNLLLNCASAWTQRKESPLFAIGLLLFLCCDTLIGLTAANGAYITLPHALVALSDVKINLPWLFYIPAQTLIALSAARLAKTAPHSAATA